MNTQQGNLVPVKLIALLLLLFQIPDKYQQQNRGEGNLAPFKPLNGLLQSSPLSLVLLHQSRLIAIIISQVS